MNLENRISGSLGWLLLGVVLLSACVMFLRIGSAPLTKSSEERVHEVASHMLETGDLLVPVFEGEPRLQKPPLYYWLAVGSARLFGGQDLWTLRFPAAVAALLMLLVVLFWSLQLGGGRLALVSTCVLACMLQFYRLGREGTAESTLALFSVLSLFLYSRLRVASRPALRNALMLAAAMALMAKATTAFLTVGLPIVVDLLARREWRQICKRAVLVRVLVALLIGAAWYICVVMVVPGALDYLLRAMVVPLGVEGAVKGSAAHYRAPWYFATEIFSAAFPASLLIPVAIWAAIRTRFYSHERDFRFVALAFAALFVAISVVPQKQKHYLLPLLPLLAILIGDSLLRLWEFRPERIRSLLPPVGLFLATVLLAFMLFLAIFLHLVLRLEPWVYGLPIAVVCACLAGAMVLAVRRRVVPFALAFLVGWFGTVAGYHDIIRPWTKTLSNAAEEELPVPGRENLLRLQEEHDWLLRVLRVEDDVQSLREAPPSSTESEDR